MSYNGYPNRATWNVSLWLNNEESLYRAKQDAVLRSDTVELLAENLENLCGELWPNRMTPDNDLLSECDWEHLAGNEWEDKPNKPVEEDTETVSEPEPLPSIEDFITKHDIKFECHRVDARPDGLMEETCNDCHGQLNALGRCHCPLPKHGTNGKMRHFRCRITYTPKLPEGKTMVSLNECSPRSFGLYFSQGSAHTENPTLADVLDCLASDASGYDGRSFDDWAEEYGYDTDSRKAEKTFRAIKRQSEQLKRTLGQEAYEELLYSTERL